ncbi:hypothetical protein QTP88_014403 [Uroleucon formosanum]
MKTSISPTKWENLYSVVRSVYSKCLTRGPFGLFADAKKRNKMLMFRLIFTSYRHRSDEWFLNYALLKTRFSLPFLGKPF